MTPHHLLFPSYLDISDEDDIYFGSLPYGTLADGGEWSIDGPIRVVSNMMTT
jgi:hypothetical protein